MKFLRNLLVVLAVLWPGVSFAQSADSPLTMTEWTTSQQKSYPTGTDGVGIAGSAVDGTYTAWTQIIASTSAAWTVTGIEVHPPSSPGDTIRWTAQLGTGAAASEVVLREINGLSDSPSQDEWNAFLPTSVAAGTRLSVRFKKVGADTGTWRFALTYFDNFVGHMAVTTGVSSADYLNQHVHFPTVSGAWGNSAYQTLIASTATPIVITSIVPDRNTLDTGNWHSYAEVDIATGVALSESVKWTVGGPNPVLNRDEAWEIRPGLRIPAGVRVALRARTDGANLNSGVTVTYYTDPGVDDITTTDRQLLTPSAADPLVVTAGATNTYGSYVEFIPTTSTVIAITGFSFYTTTGNADFEIRVATGASGSEVPISTYRIHGAPETHGWMPIVGLNIAAGKRVALQVRASGATTPVTHIKLGYVASPTFKQRSSLAAGDWPTGTTTIATTTITPAGAWTPSTYAEVVAVSAERVLLTGVSWSDSDVTAAAKELELTVATGAAGFEVPIYTYRTGTSLVAGTNGHNARVPVIIPQGTRVSVMWNSSSADVHPNRVAVDWIEGPAGFPAVRADPPHTDVLSLWVGHRTAPCHVLIPFIGVPVDGRGSEPQGNSTCDMAVDQTTGLWYSKRSNGVWTVFGNGTGTVTSVDNGTVSSLFTSSWSNTTTTPRFSLDFATQTANKVLASATSGGAAVPTFRALVFADTPFGAPASDDQVYVASSTSAGAWKSVPDCTDTGGNHINYTAATNSLSCGTSGSGGSGTVTTTGSPASGNLTKFSGATSITNGDLSGDVTTSGTLAATIANDAVTYAKMQNVSAASKLLGRGSAAGSGDPQELTLGTGLAMSGTTVNVTGSGGGGFCTTSGTTLQKGDGSGGCSTTNISDGTAPASSVAVVMVDSVGILSTASTNTEQTLYSYTVPASMLGSGAGARRLVLTLVGTYRNSSGSTDAMVMKVKYGTTVMYQDTYSNGSIAATDSFRIDLIFGNTDATNTQFVEWQLTLGSSTAPTTGTSAINSSARFYSAGVGTASEDSTTGLTFSILITHSVSNSGTDLKRFFATTVLQ